MVTACGLRLASWLICDCVLRPVDCLVVGVRCFRIAVCLIARLSVVCDVWLVCVCCVLSDV